MLMHWNFGKFLSDLFLFTELLIYFKATSFFNNSAKIFFFLIKHLLMEKLFFFSYRFPQEGLWHSYCPTYAHHFCGGSIYVHRKHQNFCSRKVLCGKSIISNCNCLPPKSALYISIVCKADKGGEWNKLSIREYFYTKPISQHQLLIVKTVWLSVDRITLQIFW